MKLRALAFLLCSGLVVLTGCNTTTDRIRQKSAVFAALPVADQARLRKGEVAVGDTTDMVYIALGAPTRRVERTTAKGFKQEWIYREYDESYEGSHVVGYRRMIGFDPRTGRRYVYLEPAYADVYRERSQDRLRVIFEDGRVTAIEELRDGR